MINFSVLHRTLVLFMLLVLTRTLTADPPAQPVGSEVLEHTIAERDAHHRVWRRDNFVTLADGRVVNRPTGYTEVATGLHYWENGEWKESRDEIEVTPTGAAATKGQHKVYVAGNVISPGAIEIHTADQRTLKFRPVCLAYTDAATGNSVVLAPVRDADGILFAPNQVVYPAAFAGVLADVRVVYTKAGFESDVIVREKLPSPADYGLNPETTLLEVWHECDAPEPVKSARTLDGLTDETLTFGTMRIGRGGAFALDGPLHRMSGAPVSKTWLKAGNPERTYLIESVRYPRVRAELDQLPDRQAAVQPPAVRSRAALLATFSPPPVRAATPVRLAFDVKTLPPSKGLVLDYVAMNSQTDPLTLQADTTYLVSGAVSLTDLIIEGGAVVKYVGSGSSPYVEFYGTVDCQTGPYRPAIFTAKDDDTVGEILSGSTGTPSGYYGYYALMPQSAGNYLHDLRISHALWGLVVGGDNEVRHAQFTACDQAIQLSFCALTVDNALFYQCSNAFSGFAGATLDARHLTAQNLFSLAHAPDADHFFNLTNSLLVNVTNWNTPGLGALNYFTNATVETTDASVLQTVGAAAHYLADSSVHRQAGLTSIPAALAADLRQRTTYPPVVWTNTTLTTNVALSPVIARGSSVPDLGYHYAPLDYVFGSNVLTNATLTLNAGTALGTFTPGTNTQALLLHRSSSVVTRGEPTNLVHIARYNVVQEQANHSWSLASPGAGLRTVTSGVAPSPSGLFSFTEWTQAAQDSSHFVSHSTNLGPFSFNHCQFNGGRLNSFGAKMDVTNSLWLRVDAFLGNDFGTERGRFYNNTLVGGQAIFDTSGGVNPPWEFFNNAFATTNVIAGVTGHVYGFNAYLTPNNRIGANVSNDLITNIVFQTGPLGRFYLTNSSPLTNRGSMNAGSAGLYHFTTTTNQHKETNSTVDIGFHYVSLNAANAAVDFDGDGLADYAEDANGNGMTDASESSISSIDTDGDGRADAQELLLDGTDPAVFTPQRLAYFPFNDTNWLGLAGQTPLGQSNAASRDAWLSKGLLIENGTNGLLKYRETEADLNANLRLANGAVRFWFKSTWDTGTGPNTPGRLIEVGTKGSASTNGWWSLYLNTNATNLIFAAETNNVGTTYLTGTISWQHCDWNQLVLNYTATNSALYLNSTLISTGWGVTLWPGATVRANGFTLGSDANGTNQAKGLFEDLEIFNHPLTASDIVENFQTNRPPNAISDLKLWLKAESVLFALSSTNRIAEWLDQTCNGIQVLQATLNSQPLLSHNELNGKPVVRFHTTNFFNLPNFPANWSEAEAFVILKAASDFPTQPRALWSLYGNAAIEYYPKTDGTIGDDFGRGAGPNDRIIPSASLAQPHLYNVVTKPNEWTSRINGVIHFSTPSNVVSWLNAQRYLGQNQNSHYFDGFVAEMLMYNRVLTDAERKRVEAYLNQRYALVNAAPAAPTNFMAQAVSPGQVGLSWNAQLSNTNVTFVVERKTNSGSFASIASLRNGGSHIDSDLRTDTVYTYRIRAENFAGTSSYSPEASVTTLTSGADIPLAHLKLWLKADSGRGASPIPFWADQSGAGNHALQQDALDRRPIVVENGVATNQPVLGFFTTNFLFLPNHSSITWTQAEGFAVLRARSYAPLVQREQWSFGNNLAEYPTKSGSSASNVVYDNFFDSFGTHSVGSPPVDLTSFHLYNPQASSNSWNSRFNGSPYFSTNAVSFTVMPNPRLGAGGNTKPWDGDMAEFMIFNRVLSSEERTAVENYLNQRYFLW
jgi:hypothetical protein